MELYWIHAPKTCRNFAILAAKTYFIGCKFHKLAKNFIIQTGDPTNSGFGGSSIYGDYFEDEINQFLKFTGAGILAMANAGPNKNGSQFFITLGLTPELNGKYTIFGRVSEGIKVVEKLNRLETLNNVPKFDVSIQNCYIKNL